MAVTSNDELKIIGVLRGDPNVDTTIRYLKTKGLLKKLINRIDSSNHRGVLVQTLAAKITHTTFPVIANELANYPKVRKVFERCFDLQTNLKPYGIVSPAPSIPASKLISAKSKDAFTGSGATGISPTSHSISALDKILLAKKSKTTVQEYSNPIPGSLSAYLAGLTPDARKSQALVMVRHKIVTVYPDSYIGGLPSRTQVINAAGKMYKLQPALIAAFILAEQRDQSKKEDAKDYTAAASFMEGNTSIGLGQVVVSTARNHNLFSGLLSTKITKLLVHDEIALLLTSDEFNIFSMAKYIRLTADKASTISKTSLPNTVSEFPGINFTLYKEHSSKWPDDNIRAMASEYTSRAWDDRVSTGWAYFVYEAYSDIVKSGAF
ncbi:MAG: hypothetical protein OQK98_15370 [Gammaproteobacteria bacterium]|nr:hypothetical protein [Gammaproteobacteria bacterium]